MKKLALSAGWQMRQCGTETSYACRIPCSVYHTLLSHNAIEDPYYRENEEDAMRISEQDFEFSTEFSLPSGYASEHMELCFDGIDTIAEIYLNGVSLGATDNMHRSWRFDVTALLQEQNTLTVIIHSPLQYIAQKQAEHPLWGVDSTVAGFPHIRKAHYMFGWDWGPKLPDMGIWREVSLVCWNGARIQDVYYRQLHENGTVTLTAELHTQGSLPVTGELLLTSPDGTLLLHSDAVRLEHNRASITARIENPELWWTNGLGKQPLYTARILLRDEQGQLLDETAERIGLRTVTIRQEPDAWGESFCIHLKGKDIFAMGANIIPQDSILPRVTPETTRKLLQSCVDANFNVVRIWGGGIYPDQVFYDFCDEHGLLVWQDFMFACANYWLTDEFWHTVEAEMHDNILRLRNHPSLCMWCGNNEIETAFETWGLPDNPEAKADYLEQFENRMPAIVKALDPQHFYWRSSPSAYGGCKDTSSNHAGDMHYWDVWHGFKPFTAFRELYYRFNSEYGFESVPSLKTLLTVCDPAKGDLNLMSPVMEAHQKCAQGNEKLMYYLAQMVRYPESFEELIYSSQLVQAECIRANVEHMRRARGRCMGSVYWQLNDTNPVISWSSIDFFGRWKGLHYYAKRFHAPVLLSVEERDAAHPVFNVSNESAEAVSGTIRWALRRADSSIITEGSLSVSCPALSACDLPALDLSSFIRTERDKRSCYLSYALETENGILSESTVLFVVPKQFAFQKPEIHTEICEKTDQFEITVSADAFVKAVCLDCRTLDPEFSDNWFDLHGNEPITVTIPRTEGLTLAVLRDELIVRGT